MIYIKNAYEGSVSSRNHMLQSALREKSNKYSIDQEYPLVLSPSAYDRSFCLFSHDEEKETVLAHLNFLPRWVMSDHEKKCQIGLIGNIATHEAYRGLGYVKHLMHHIEEAAVMQGLSALMLWSHLNEFYLKLGFKPFGKELRFFLRPHLVPALDELVFRLEEEDMNPAMVEHLKKLRPPSLCLERSPEEFALLLQIPDTVLLTYCENGLPRGYVIIGKGQDMVGVIHEWGADSPAILSRLAGFIQKQTGYQQLLLLAPFMLEETWKQVFLDMSLKVEEHPLCLAKILKEEDSLEKLFIWGLDSI